MSVQSVRTSLNHLMATGVITTRSTNKYTIITIVNWDSYQHQVAGDNPLNNQSVNQGLTHNQPATNHIQQSKKEKKGRKKNECGGLPPNKKKSIDTIDEQAKEVLEHLNLVTGKTIQGDGTYSGKAQGRSYGGRVYASDRF